MLPHWRNIDVGELCEREVRVHACVPQTPHSGSSLDPSTSRPLLALVRTQGLSLTKEWMEAVVGRDSVQRTSAGKPEMARASKLYYVTHVSPGAPGTL